MRADSVLCDSITCVMVADAVVLYEMCSSPHPGQQQWSSAQHQRRAAAGEATVRAE